MTETENKDNGTQEDLKHASGSQSAVDGLVGLPAPYYDQDGITIYNGDSISILEQLIAGGLEADTLITDPPYASGARTEAKKTSSGAMLRGDRFAKKPIENDQMTTTGFTWLIRQVCYLARDFLKEGSSVIYFIDWRQWPNLVGAVETTNLRTNKMIVWDKLSYGLGNGFRSQHELVLHASIGVPTIYNRSVGDVLSFKRTDNSDHPSPKPVGLMEEIIKVTMPDDGIIVDPFMGAGSTLVAAQRLGRRCIGIEWVEKHCETAVKRLAQRGLF